MDNEDEAVAVSLADRMAAVVRQIGKLDLADSMQANHAMALIRSVTDCETCGPADGPLRGILLTGNGPESVACCDDCLTYPGDLHAAYALAQRVGGVVRFWQHDAELLARIETEAESSFQGLKRIRSATWAELGFEQRAYDGRDTLRTDDCILTETYPWIEISGRPVDWEHYRAVFEGFGGKEF